MRLLMDNAEPPVVGGTKSAKVGYHATSDANLNADHLMETNAGHGTKATKMAKSAHHVAMSTDQAETHPTTKAAKLSKSIYHALSMEHWARALRPYTMAEGWHAGRVCATSSGPARVPSWGR